MLYIPSWAGKHGRSRRKRDAVGRHDIHSIFKGVWPIWPMSSCLEERIVSWTVVCQLRELSTERSQQSFAFAFLSQWLWGGRVVSLGGASWVSSHLDHSWFPAAEQPPAPKGSKRKLSMGSTHLPFGNNWEKGGSNLLFMTPKSGNCPPVVACSEMQGLGRISTVSQGSHGLRLVAADAKVLAL